MSNIYIINNTSGEALFAIQPKAVNGPNNAGHDTDLTLYGYSAPNWGERFNENFYRLLENFAIEEKVDGDPGYDALSPSPKSDTSTNILSGYGINQPTVGQIWYNKTQQKLFVCTQSSPTVVWSPIASDDTSSAYVAKSGDTMTGILILSEHPTVLSDPLQAATKGYVDTQLASISDNYVRKSGSTMNPGATIVLGRDPTGAMDAVTKQYVDALSGGSIVDPVKIGTIVPFAGLTTPTNWLPCYGQAVSRTSYNELFGVIGTTFGAGDGSTTFNLPDFRGRMPVGPDNFGGTSANVVTNINADTLGGKYGAEAHTLTSNEMPSHTHTGSSSTAGGHTHTGSTSAVGDHVHGFPGSIAYTGSPFGMRAGTDWYHNYTSQTNAGGSHSHTMSLNAAGDHSHTMSLNSTGGSAAHNNLQPSITMYYIIKAKPEAVNVGGGGGDYVAKGGDSMYGSLTMTGATDITLARAPTLPMHAVTKQYVDACCSGAGGDSTWTYRTTISTKYSLSSTSWTNCGSVNVSVTTTTARKGLIIAHVPIDVRGYPFQVFIRMLVDGVAVDHNSFNINPITNAMTAGQALSLHYTGDLAPGTHTISFQGRLDSLSEFDSGDYVHVNGVHRNTGETDPDGYTRIDVIIPGGGGSGASSAGSADENYIINGNFDIWERLSAYSASGGALVPPPTNFVINGVSQYKYTADRWFVASPSTGTFNSTISRINATPGEVKGYSTYDLHWSITSATNYLVFGQRIEHASTLADGNITVSFSAKQIAGPTTPLTVRAVQYFGSGGSTGVVVTSSDISLSGTMTEHQVTLNLPSIAGKTVGLDSFLEIAFVTPTSVSGVTYVFSRVQVEEGTTGTRYKFRSVGTEAELCSRYFQQGYFNESKNTTPYVAGPNALTNETWIPFQTRMRKIPAISHAFHWGGQTGIYPEGTLGYGQTTNGPTLYTSQVNGFSMSFAGFSTFPLGGSDASLAGWWQAQAEL